MSFSHNQLRKITPDDRKTTVTHLFHKFRDYYPEILPDVLARETSILEFAVNEVATSLLEYSAAIASYIEAHSDRMEEVSTICGLASLSASEEINRQMRLINIFKESAPQLGGPSQNRPTVRSELLSAGNSLHRASLSLANNAYTASPSLAAYTSPGQEYVNTMLSNNMVHPDVRAPRPTRTHRHTSQRRPSRPHHLYEPTQPPQPSPLPQRSQRLQLSQSPQPLELSRPSELRQLSQPSQPLELYRPPQPYQLSQPSQPLELYRPPQPYQLSQPSQPPELSRPPQPRRLSQPSQPLEPYRPPQQYQLSQPRQPLEQSRPPQPRQLSQSFPLSQPHELSQPSQPLETSRRMVQVDEVHQPFEGSQPLQPFQKSRSSQVSQRSEPLQQPLLPLLRPLQSHQQRPTLQPPAPLPPRDTVAPPGPSDSIELARPFKRPCSRKRKADELGRSLAHILPRDNSVPNTVARPLGDPTAFTDEMILDLAKKTAILPFPQVQGTQIAKQGQSQQTDHPVLASRFQTLQKNPPSSTQQTAYNMQPREPGKDGQQTVRNPVSSGSQRKGDLPPEKANVVAKWIKLQRTFRKRLGDLSSAVHVLHENGGPENKAFLHSYRIAMELLKVPVSKLMTKNYDEHCCNKIWRFSERIVKEYGGLEGADCNQIQKKLSHLFSEGKKRSLASSSSGGLSSLREPKSSSNPATNSEIKTSQPTQPSEPGSEDAMQKKNLTLGDNRKDRAHRTKNSNDCPLRELREKEKENHTLYNVPAHSTIYESPVTEKATDVIDLSCDNNEEYPHVDPPLLNERHRQTSQSLHGSKSKKAERTDARTQMKSNNVTEAQGNETRIRRQAVQEIAENHLRENTALHIEVKPESFSRERPKIGNQEGPISREASAENVHGEVHTGSTPAQPNEKEVDAHIEKEIMSKLDLSELKNLPVENESPDRALGANDKFLSKTYLSELFQEEDALDKASANEKKLTDEQALSAIEDRFNECSTMTKPCRVLIVSDILKESDTKPKPMPPKPKPEPVKKILSLFDAVREDCRQVTAAEYGIICRVSTEPINPTVKFQVLVPELYIPTLTLRVGKCYPSPGSVTNSFERPYMGWVGPLKQMRARFQEQLEVTTRESWKADLILTAWISSVSSVLRPKKSNDSPNPSQR